MKKIMRLAILTVANCEKKMRSKTKWFLGFVLVFLFLELTWADPKTEGVIKDIQSKNSTIIDYRCDTVMKIKGLMGDTVTSVGKMSYKKPDKFYLEMKMDKPMAIGINHEGPLTTIVVSDGDMFYQYEPEKKIVQKINLKEMGRFSSNDILNRIGFDFVTKIHEGLVKEGFQYAGEEELYGGKMYILQKEEPTILPGAEPPYNYDKTKFWIGREDGFLRKMATSSISGKMEMGMSTEFKNVEINPIFAEDTFLFTPPEGVQILDQTEEIKKGMIRSKSGGE